jgi:AraC-like DNA-binding protein
MLSPKDGTPNALRSLIADTIVPRIESGDGSRFFLAGKELPEIEFDIDVNPEYEQHHFIEACFCLKGRAEIWIDERLKVVSENDLLILPANLSHSPSVLHCISCPPEQVFSRLLWFSPFPYGAILSICESVKGQHFGTPRQFFLTPHINPYFQNFVLELSRKESNYRTMAKYNLLQALMWICRAQTTELSQITEDIDETRWQKAKYDSTIEKVKDFIHQHYNTPLELDTLARAVAVNKSTLCRSFKKETGTSVIDYLIKVRIDSSKRLLMSGLKVSNVAQLVGFEDPYYFSRMFKKVTGDSPKIFKVKEHLE